MPIDRTPMPMPDPVSAETSLLELLRQAMEGFLPPTRAAIALLDRVGAAR